MALPTAAVQQLRLEVHTADAQLGRLLPEQLSRLFHSSLLRVLTEELAGFDPAGPPRQLPQLVLELAPLPASRLDQDLPERLRAALRQALSGLALPSPAGAMATGLAAPDPLAFLRYFLLNGYLPWQAGSPQFELDAAVSQAMPQHPAAMHALLRQVGAQARPRQRLVQQLALKTLEQLIDFLEPAHASVVRAYLRDTLAAHRRQPLVPASEPVLRQVTYELAVTDLLANWHTHFNRRAFVERQLRQLAAHYSLVFEELLLHLVSTLPTARLAPSLAATLPGVIHALYQQAQPPLTTRAAYPAAPASRTRSAANQAFPALASPAARASAGTGESNTPYMALVYYLRHSSLPPAWGQQFSQPMLLAQLEVVLAQGRAALQQLAAAAGRRPVVAALLHHLPAARWQQVAQTLAPGQARPLLLLLEELAKQAPPLTATSYKAELWQQSLEYLLASPTTAAPARQPPPALRQWLPLQVPPPAAWATGPPATPEAAPSRSRLFSYLLFGRAASSLPLSWLQSALHALLAQDAGQLITFLRQHLATRPVLRHLATLVDFSLLTKLLPGTSRHSAGKTASTKAALAALLGGPTPGPARQQLLREAYLLFHLRQKGGRVAAGLATIQALLLAYHLPAQALYEYLRRHAQRPALASNSFLSWLLQSLAAALGSRQRAAAQAQVAVAAAIDFSAYLPASEAFFSSAGKAAGKRATQPILFLPSTASFLKFFQPGGYLQQLPSTRPARHPATYHLTRPATVPEAQEAVFRYLLATGFTPPPALLKPLLRWVVARQPAALLGLLRRSAASSPLWPRLAALADFALLSQLLAKASQHSQPAKPRPGLADLDELAAGPGSSPRLLLFLKITCLLTHYRPAAEASGEALWQLATHYGLPRPATTTKLTRLAQRWPWLAATTFFDRLLAPQNQRVTGFFGLSPAATLSSQARHQHAARPEAPARPVYQTVSRTEKTLSVRPEVPAPDTPATAQAAASWPTPRPTGAATALATQNLLLHYLLHGQAPWWYPDPLPADDLARMLRQAARQPQPLREFLGQHARDARVRRHLASVADFSLLHELLPPAGGRGQRQLVRPALAALDRSLRRPTGGSQARFRLFLQEAYVAFGAGGPPAGSDPLAPARQLAAAVGWPWRTVLARAGGLLRQHPTLAADPFFAALLYAALHQPGTGRARVRARQPAEPTTPPAGQPATASARPPAAEAAWQLLERYLQTGQAPPTGDLPLALAELLRPAHAALLARLRPYLGLPTGRGRLAGSLPTRQLLSLLRQLWPAAYQQLAAPVRDWLRLLALGVVPGGVADATPARLWVEVLAIAASGVPPAALATTLIGRLLRAAAPRQAPAQTAQQLLRLIGQRRIWLRGPLAAWLAALLAAPAKPPVAPVAIAPATSPPPQPTVLRLKPEPDAPGPTETVYIANAGLVLLWPFFTLLFDRLGYLEQRQFKDPAAADRATHLLQFLVTGEENFPEYQLVLNKLLCGIAQPRPLPRAVPLGPAEKATGEGLLGAALGQWPVLKNTSMAGLRETFLQRPGKLDWHAERVTLTVETKTVDILLDQLPWSISLIKLPWMALPLYVTWR